MESNQREEPAKRAEEKKTLPSLIQKFMGYTTAHGIGRLAESKTIFWKIFWTSVCMGAFGMFIHQVYDLFQLYLSKPVSTSVTMKFDKQLVFPAVTICNLNMLRKDALPNQVTNTLQKELKYNDTDSGKNIEQQSVDQLTRIWETFSVLLGSYEVDDLYDRGHQFSELVVTCTWKGLDCKAGNLSKLWSRTWNYKYGNCFTFNGGVDEDNNKVQILKSSKPGPSQGLKLMLDIDQEQYVGPLSIEAGVRVVLHDQGQMPFPHEEGFSVSPGMASSIGLKKTKIERLDRFSNNSCWSENELPNDNIYRKYRNITRYSQQACLNSCLGLSQWHTCKCSESAYPSAGTPCDIFNKTTSRCLQFVQYLFNNDKLKCLNGCKQPCKEEAIQKTISSSRWPSKAYQTYLVTQGESRNESDDYLLVNVFYNELNYEKIEEKYSYGSVNLIADIGGQLGLWIGISVLTCCEVLELFMKIFSHMIKKCNKVTQEIEPMPPYD